MDGQLKIGSGFSFDASDFMEKLNEYIQTFPAACESAVHEALIQLREDAETVEPTVPKEMGDLRQDVETEAKRKGDGSIDGQIVYKMPYATRMHEEEKVNYTTGGSGAKYLETKLANGQKYGKIMADTIKDETGT